MAIRYLSGINVDSNTLFVDSTNNRVGIGTGSPTYKLDVVGEGRVSDAFMAGGAINIDNNLAIQISSAGAGTQRWIGINKNNGYGLIIGYIENAAALNGVGAYIRQVTSDPIHFLIDNATTAMSIVSGGNVLIGTTTNAGYKLDVNGNGRYNASNFSLTIGTTTGDALYITSSGATSGTGNYGSGIVFAGVGTTNRRAAIVAVQSTGSSDSDRCGLAFMTHPSSLGSANMVESMRIRPEGNLIFNSYGSGNFTGTPAYNLGVDSSGNVIELPGGVVDGSGTANYVTKWQDANTVGDSQIVDNGTAVAIGTSSISTTVTPFNLTIGKSGAVAASMVLTNGASDVWGFMYGNSTKATVAASGFLAFETGATWTEKARITSGGNFLIGATTDAGYKLDVNGTGRFSGNLQLVTTGGTRLTMSGTDNGIVLNDTTVTAAARNWGIFTSLVAEGDFVIQVGSSQGAAPSSNVLYFASTGAATFSSSVTALKYIANAQATYASITYEETFKYASSPAGIWFGNSFNSNNNVGMQLRVSNDSTSVQALTLSPTGEATFSSSVTAVRGFFNSGGNATDPIISVTGDTNTGFFFPSADTIATTTGGVERMRIASNGAIKFNAYGSGSVTGTAAYALSVDSSGNVIESASPLNATSLYDLLPAGRVAYNWVGQVVNDAWTTVFTKNDNILTTGTWMVKMYVNDFSVGGGHYQYVYSGVMTWEQGTVNQTGEAAFSEVYLHRMGHAANASILYLRTAESGAAGGNIGYFQIKGNYSNTANQTIQFQFVKIF